MSITPTTEMSLPQIRALVDGLHEKADESVEKVEASAAELYANKNATLQYLTAQAEYWGGLEAELQSYRRRADRRRNEASLDYREKFNNKVKHGPQGRLAAGSAWGEREASANSEFIVEWKKFELLTAVVSDLDQAVRIIRAHRENVSFNRQANLRAEARAQKFSSNLDYQGQ